ncbi:hypothetical protein [Quisquiliibacterium transsilvanicum]|uniref:Uncharacterized protein n=1 Tax=Quisquiliibacterium transsilvanicum TaxID=1549638 RepID=A0A7W8M7V1_9BURK|nr:hypothetical protein [Quisquiliibacterium transsilvanicum]MBB5271376.1 hypothetical protein [Quisquiliibacterium transsilvanicum]
MKRTIITILAMLPAVLLAIPAVVALIDAAAWVALGDTLIQQDWSTASMRGLIAVSAGALSIPVGMLTLSVLSDWQRRQE